MKLYFAPIQGHTDAAYRAVHARHYNLSASETSTSPDNEGQINLFDHVIYTTPFIRLEKGEIRKKDLKDLSSQLNEGLEVLPQVIFRNEMELRSLVDLMREDGKTSIDINMGCPFPLQTSKGRGAAAIGNPDCISAVEKVIRENQDIVFSVKMRLGFDKEEFKPLMETLNNLKLDHITVHPRTAKDQYSGELHLDAFDEIYNNSANALVFNGEISTPGQAQEIIDKYPRLHGLMIGRGALARPSIFNEIITGKDWDEELRRKELLKFHRELWDYYSENLTGGDHQILAKILPFWEYSEQEIGRKAWKAIRKASNISKYQTALALI